jgi:hypothetical protein
MTDIQVNKDHYSFGSYMTMRRWASIWTQLHEISKLSPDKVLEVGPGKGVLKAIGAFEGLNISTVDLDPDLKPDHIGTLQSLPFESGSYDLVCAFQVLEHIEYVDVPSALRKLKRVSAKNVLISLPNAQIVWRYRIYLPTIGERDFMFRRPFWKAVDHKFDGEHYWELNKKGYEVDKIVADFAKEFKILKHWRLWDNPYHHFFLLEVFDG